MLEAVVDGHSCVESALPGLDDLARTERIAWEVVEGRPADDAARALCDALGGCDAYASLVDPRTGQGLGEGFAYLDPSLVDLMEREFSTPDTSPFLRAMPRMAPNVFHHCTDILDFATVRRTAFYADWWIPSGVRDHAGGIMLPAPDGRLVWVVIGCLGDRDWLDAEELRFAEAACGGIARALRTTASIAHAAAGAALDAREPDPCWLMGADGRVHLANDPAREMPMDTVQYRHDGALALVDPGAQRRLCAILAEIGGRDGDMRDGGEILMRNGGSFARLTVEPGPSYRDERTALVTLRRPQPMTWSADELGIAFGLTPSEARTVLALAQGGGTREIAATLGIGTDTVRIYLKRAYAKVGVADRSALVARLLLGDGDT